MGTVKLEKNEIRQAAAQAKHVANYMDDYADEITRKVINRLNRLSGGDPEGYISSAKACATSKIQQLRDSHSSFQDFNLALVDFQEFATEKDQSVASRMTMLANPYKPPLGIQSVINSAGCFLFDLFCVKIPGDLSSLFPGADKVIHSLRKGWNNFTHWKEDTREYYEYGDGQYEKAVITSVIKTGLAIAAAITAMTVSGPLAVIGIISGAIYLVTSIMNTTAVVSHNLKAAKANREGRKDLAHYYASTEGVKDWAKKTDQGDVGDNLDAEIVAGGIDIAHNTSKAICCVLSVAKGMESLGEIRSPDGNTVTKYDYSFDNIKRNALKEFRENQMESGINYQYQNVNGVQKLVETNHLSLDKFLFRGPTESLEKALTGTNVDTVKFTLKITESIYDTVTCSKSGMEELIDALPDIFRSDPELDLWERISMVKDAFLVGPMDAYTDQYVDPIFKVGDPLHDILTT